MQAQNQVKRGIREGALSLDLFAFMDRYQGSYPNHQGSGARELARVWYSVRRSYAKLYGCDGCFVCRRDRDGAVKTCNEMDLSVSRCDGR